MNVALTGRANLCTETYKNWWEADGQYNNPPKAGDSGMYGLGQRIATHAFFAGWSSADAAPGNSELCDALEGLLTAIDEGGTYQPDEWGSREPVSSLISTVAQATARAVVEKMR